MGIEQEKNKKMSNKQGRRESPIANPNSLGALIRELRHDQGYNISELAEAVDMKPEEISAIELGNLGVTRKTLPKLMHLLPFYPESEEAIITKPGHPLRFVSEDTFGASLRRKRLEKEWSQEELGRAIGDTGKNPANKISRLEHSQKDPKPEVRKRLIVIFGEELTKKN